MKLPYLENNICVNQCSKKNAIWDERCINCGDEDLFFHTDRTVCLKNCPVVHYKNDCLDKCPSSYDIPLYRENNTCVEKCSENYGLNSLLECIVCQKLIDLYCDETCPPGTQRRNNKCEVIQQGKHYALSKYYFIS